MNMLLLVLGMGPVQNKLTSVQNNKLDLSYLIVRGNAADTLAGSVV